MLVAHPWYAKVQHWEGVGNCHSGYAKRSMRPWGRHPDQLSLDTNAILGGYQVHVNFCSVVPVE